MTTRSMKQAHQHPHPISKTLTTSYSLTVTGLWPGLRRDTVRCWMHSRNLGSRNSLAPNQHCDRGQVFWSLWRISALFMKWIVFVLDQCFPVLFFFFFLSLNYPRKASGTEVLNPSCGAVLEVEVSGPPSGMLVLWDSGFWYGTWGSDVQENRFRNSITWESERTPASPSVLF